MLRITQQTNPQQAKRYFTAADYYADGQEIVGGWGGRGAGMLGLAGTVDKASFDRLCDNLDPRTGGPLTAGMRSDRTVGYDFTFSVPKSVSLLYGLTGDGDVLAAFRGAVAETMQEIESEAKARVRKGGRDAERATGNLVWAEYVHTTSRPVDGVPDPHLHAHMFVFNATFDTEEQQWKAGQFRDIKRDAPYFQAAFRVRLAGKLQELGYALERTRDDFEIAGVPRAVVRQFSRRTAQIEELAGELGITDPVSYAPGDLLRFHQHAPGHTNGSRLVLGEGDAPPVAYAGRFEVFRPGALAVAVGDRLRVTARGATKDGKHKLVNGALLTVRGFTRGGDLVVDHGWVVARDFGHLAHGYVVTSHAAQGRTVNTVLVGEAGESLAAADRRQFYVSVSRGTDRTLVFTDDKTELLKAVSRAGETASALAVAEAAGKLPLRTRLRKHVAFINRLATFARTHEPPSYLAHRSMTADREAARDR